MSTLQAYLKLMRLDRPIGTFLLLWPTLWALWLAGDGRPDPTIVLIFIAGTFVMRSAGCVINDLADRKFDRQVRRTMDRPLASGRLEPSSALALFVLLLLLAFWLVMQLNSFSRLLAVFAVILASAYPFAKRITHLPQLVLGIAFSWGIPMAYAAIGNALPLEMFLLFAANFAWIVAYDTQYAMADREDDLAIGVKSTAILFGRFDNLVIGLLHLLCLGLLIVLGQQRGFHWHYYLGLGLALCFAVYQQYLCREREAAACFRAFLNNNWFGAMVFCGILLGLLAP